MTNTNDSGAGSLRQAVLDANGAAFATAIGFNIPGADPGCSGGSCTITLTSGELVVSKDLTIAGPAANQLTISGNNSSRVFNVQSGQVSIGKLTIANGSTASPGGAGMLNSANLTLTDCIVSTNNTTSAGGGITTTSGTTISITPLLLIRLTVAEVLLLAAAL